MLAVDSAQSTNVRREPIGSRLISIAENYYDLSPGTLRNKKRRNGRVSRARWAVATVLTDAVGWSQPRIGGLLNADASAIHYAYRRSQQLLRSDPLFFDIVRKLTEEVSPT